MASSFLFFFFFFFFSSLTLFFIANAQERAPHGIVYENPVAFSPSAYDFFNPKTQVPETKKNPCSTSNSCSPLPIAAQVEASKAEESKMATAQKGKGGLGGGAIAGVVFGVALVVLSAMGVYYVFVTRRANMNRANSVQPDA